MSAERIVRVGPEAREPILSVLTPFYRDNPRALIAAIGRAPAGVEFVLLDDGSRDVELLTSLTTAAATLGASVRIVVWERHQGRSLARNRLIKEARGQYVLFLDADIIPDRQNFFSRWLDLIERKRPFVAFGGLSVEQVKPTRATALHRDLFLRSECANAKRRARSALQCTPSSNLLVRRAVFQRLPFDPDFVGGGFDDADWALRAARYTRILHIDNPATRAGLDNVSTLLRKSAEAGPTFARLVEKHPRSTKRFSTYRAARFLKRLPGRAALRALSARIARSNLAPMPARRIAFKLFRASHYSEHLA